MSTSTKTYQPLSQLPSVKIEKCSAMLPNHCQCWRAGDQLVTVETEVPATKDAEEKDVAATTSITTYQLCNFHVVEAQNMDAAQAKADADLAAAQAEEAKAATPKK